MDWTAPLQDRGQYRRAYRRVGRTSVRALAAGALLCAAFAVGMAPAALAETQTAGQQPSDRTVTTTKPEGAAPARLAPRLATVRSTRLAKADIAALTDAFAEADRKNWPEAMRHARRLDDPVAVTLVQWNRLVAQDSGATLAEIVAFQERNADWPRQALLSRRAEEALLAYPMSAEDVLNWFAAHPPVTGEGKIRFGQALIAAGRKEDGKGWLQRAWVEDDFSTSRQKEILANFRPYLGGSTHRARLDRLLWDGRTRDAKLTTVLIGADALALAEARIQLMRGAKDATSALSRVPAGLKNDPGLIFDRVRYERRRGNDDAALPLILTAPNEPHAKVAADAWWIERRIAARKALVQGQYKEAYRIVSDHGLKSGADFADAEFMSGWIALQYLNDTGAALGHFTRLADGVSTPISKARAEYWLGRAASASGDKRTAARYYKQAAAYPTTFYGQLGTAALAGTNGSTGRLHLAKDPRLTKEDKASFDKLELVHAARILHDFDRDDQMWSFMLHLADILVEPTHVAALSDLALAFGDPRLSLRVAKNATQRNIVLAQRAYPTAAMPAFPEKGPRVEKALVYGLSRQESEFDGAVVSPAGARGLMQLMPATAKLVAKQIGVPYSRPRLTNDPAYNAMLGAAHLGDLVENYSGSYIMGVAAYNAGATRVGEWSDKFGDPRSTAVDPIDWIENIPFSETRNYVQRVMENLEVYRSRLSGNAERVRLAEDLRRHTGATIDTPVPTPGRIPLASPLIPASAMAPVVEAEESAPTVGAATRLVEATGTAPVPTPLAPKRRAGARQ